MSEIIDKFYTPLLIGHGFIRDPDNQQYGAFGDMLETFSRSWRRHLLDLWTERPYMTLRYTTFHSMRISCWNFLCRNV